MKRVFFVLVCISFLHGSVASALEACLRNEGNSDQISSGHPTHFDALESHDESTGPSVPIIHCSSLWEKFGPAARAAATDIRRSDEGVALHAASFPYAGFAVLGSELWLEALFKKLVTFSLPIDLSRHLFLSVLQI